MLFQCTFPEAAIAHLWSRVDTSGECWPHGNSLTRYGRLNVDGVPTLAHQMAFSLRYGPIPSGFEVCHTCDFRPCCRNDGDLGVYEVRGIDYPRYGHLWLGTSAANAADMADKKRGTLGDRNPSRLYPERVQRGDGHWSHRNPEWVRKGAAHHSAKLTEADVREIRARWATGLETQRAIAASKSIGYKLVNAVVKGHTWPHVI